MILNFCIGRFNDGHDSKCSKGSEGQRHQFPKSMEAPGSTMKYYWTLHSLDVKQIDAMCRGKSNKRYKRVYKSI